MVVAGELREEEEEDEEARASKRGKGAFWFFQETRRGKRERESDALVGSYDVAPGASSFLSRSPRLKRNQANEWSSRGWSLSRSTVRSGVGCDGSLMSSVTLSRVIQGRTSRIKWGRALSPFRPPPARRRRRPSNALLRNNLSLFSSSSTTKKKTYVVVQEPDPVDGAMSISPLRRIPVDGLVDERAPDAAESVRGARQSLERRASSRNFGEEAVVLVDWSDGVSERASRVV